MLQLSQEMIKEIAGQLDMGMICFYHLPTGELVSYPDELKMGGAFEEEFWREDMDKVDENNQEYVRFTGMESYESYKLMEDFISLISDQKVQDKFEQIIQKRKPFQQFKNLLLDYPDLRQQWFSYKDQRYKEYVQEQLDSFNRSLQKEEE